MKIQNQLKEIGPEFKRMFFGKNKLIDIVLPTFTFIISYRLFGIEIAAYISLALIVVVSVWRLIRKEKVSSIAMGFISVGLAVFAVLYLGKSESYFLPGLVQNAALTVLIILSLLVRRPVVAWTSFFSNRWTLKWYWHPKVLPAYMQVTYIWLLYFIIKTFLMYFFYVRAETEILAVIGTLTSWPGFILLLIISYVLGSSKLEELAGPSVDEFNSGAKEPFKSQTQGF